MSNAVLYRTLKKSDNYTMKESNKHDEEKDEILV